MAWRPQEEGLGEICGLLEQHISPTSDKSVIWKQLQHYKQFSDFNNYLAFIFAHAEVMNDGFFIVFVRLGGLELPLTIKIGVLVFVFAFFM